MVAAVVRHVIGMLQEATAAVQEVGQRTILEQWVAVAQIVSAVATGVLAFAVFLQIREARRQAQATNATVEEMRASRRAQERPQVIVDADYSHRHFIYVLIRNIGGGAAKNISFEFSQDMISSLSEKPDVPYGPLNEHSYFKSGIQYIAPGAELRFFWDGSRELLKLLRERGLEQGITVTSKYEDLEGNPHETEWTFNPIPIGDRAYIRDEKGIADLAYFAEEINATLYDLLQLLAAQRENRDG